LAWRLRPLTVVGGYGLWLVSLVWLCGVTVVTTGKQKCVCVARFLGFWVFGWTHIRELEAKGYIARLVADNASLQATLYD